MGNKGDKDSFGLLVLAGLGVLVVVAVVLAWPGINIKVDYTTVTAIVAMAYAILVRR